MVLKVHLALLVKLVQLVDKVLKVHPDPLAKKVLQAPAVSLVRLVATVSVDKQVKLVHKVPLANLEILVIKVNQDVPVKKDPKVAKEIKVHLDHLAIKEFLAPLV
jgi:hypothetical protein